MNPINESVQLLIENIELMAKAEIDLLQKDAEEKTENADILLEKELKEQYGREVGEAVAKQSRLSREKAMELTKKSSEKIQGIREEVYTAVADKTKLLLEDFVKSEQYDTFFLSAAKKISLYCNKACTVYVKEKDKELAKELDCLFEKVDVVCDDEKIRYGGMICVFDTESITVDNTLDSLFKEKTDYFVNHAQLGF